MYDWPVQDVGIEELSPIVIEEKGEEEQADRKSIFEDMCEDAPESKIQFVPSWLLSVKLFMAAMKTDWSQLGGAVDGDGVGMYGSAGGAPYM